MAALLVYAALCSHILVSFLLIVAGAAQLLLQGNRYEDPPQSAATFKQMLQQRYGADCPDFLETSWQDAAVQAHRQYKFLFVYLHSPDHEVSPDVNRRMLALSVDEHGSLFCAAPQSRFGADVCGKHPWHAAQDCGSC